MAALRGLPALLQHPDELDTCAGHFPSAAQQYGVPRDRSAI